VDFSAEWCAPCKLLKPVLEEIADTLGGRLTVVRLDADAAPTVAGTYGVQSLPTLLLFQNGEPVQRLVGALTKGALKAKVEQALAATVA
jgi:thioredoxin